MRTNTSQASEVSMNKKEILNWKKRSNTSTHAYQLRNRNNTPPSYKTRAAKYLLAQHIFGTANNMYNDSGNRLSIDTLLYGSDGKKWIPALSNEWGRLAQVNNTGVEATDRIEFIINVCVPPDRKVTYASFVCDHRPLKDEK